MTDKAFKLNGAQPAPEPKDLGEFFGDMTDHLREIFLAEDIGDERASQLIYDVVLRLSETFAGESFYVTNKPKVYAKWMRVYSEIQYMPSQLVDKKHGFSQGYSLKIKQKINDQRQEREQLRLF